jgi:hypothetical protein
MIKQVKCPGCNSVMMYAVQDGVETYTCVHNHPDVGRAFTGVHMSENLVEAYRELGNNVDLLMEYLKRP